MFGVFCRKSLVWFRSCLGRTPVASLIWKTGFKKENEVRLPWGLLLVTSEVVWRTPVACLIWKTGFKKKNEVRLPWGLLLGTWPIDRSSGASWHGYSPTALAKFQYFVSHLDTLLRSSENSRAPTWRLLSRGNSKMMVCGMCTYKTDCRRQRYLNHIVLSKVIALKAPVFCTGCVVCNRIFTVIVRSRTLVTLVTTSLH